MLTLDRPARDIPGAEFFDNRSQEFITIEPRHIESIFLQLEHSLMSIAKWEAKWHVPFIGREQLSADELKDYVRCMTINTQKDMSVYDRLTEEDLLEIVKYMQDEHSAWEIKPKKGDKKRKKQDSVEAIYYAMIQYGIPLECEKWHFNRLMALIDFCDSKGGSTSGAGGPAKRSQKEIMEMYRAMNEKARKKYNSKG